MAVEHRAEELLGDAEGLLEANGRLANQGAPSTAPFLRLGGSEVERGRQPVGQGLATALCFPTGGRNDRGPVDPVDLERDAGDVGQVAGTGRVDVIPAFEDGADLLGDLLFDGDDGDRWVLVEFGDSEGDERERGRFRGDVFPGRARSTRNSSKR